MSNINLPTTGGSYSRDAATGALSRQPEDAEPAASLTAAAPVAAENPDPAPPSPRRATSSKGVS